MNIENLETFVILADLKSYTKTAQRLFTTQSTVSKRIVTLEKFLGQQLLIRNNRQVVLTSAGEKFLIYAEKMLALQQETIMAMNAQAEEGGKLVIGFVGSLFESHGIDFIAGFSKRFPKISVKIIIDHSRDLLNAVYDGEIDICFSYCSFTENNYECLPFFTDEMVLVASPDLPAYPEGVLDKDLMNLPLLHETLSRVIDRVWIDKIFSRGQYCIDVGKANHLIPFLKQGIGYGFVIKASIREELESGQLREIPLLEHQLAGLESYIVFRTTGNLAKKAFADFIRRKER